MDRNGLGVCHYRDDVVALRKESVDRNGGLMSVVRFAAASLSARRAWIEIRYRIVIPRKNPSLSARRAWIEIVAAASKVK